MFIVDEVSDNRCFFRSKDGKPLEIGMALAVIDDNGHGSNFSTGLPPFQGAARSGETKFFTSQGKAHDSIVFSPDATMADLIAAIRYLKSETGIRLSDD